MLHPTKYFNKFLLTFYILTFQCFAANKPPKISKHPVVIIISYDSFRPDYFNKTETPNMDRVKAEGVTIPYLQNQFVTYTFPNHHSIATGLYEESHGIISNKFYDPLYGKILSGFEGDPGFWNYSSQILPLYTVNELAGNGRHSGVMMWPGSNQPWGTKKTVASYIAPFKENTTFESRVDTVFDWITHPTKPANLVFLYFQEPDHLGHSFGPDGPENVGGITLADNLTGYILKKSKDLGLLDKINLIFLSDHGMHEVEPGNFATYKHIVENKNQSMYFEQGVGSPILQVLPKRASDTQKIYDAFKAAESGNHFKAYLKSTVNKVKPYWHYANNRRIMPIYLVSEAGYVFEGSKPQNRTTGSHGWDNHLQKMRAYFMARGPLFKKNKVEKSFENVDIFPLICHIMNIKPPNNNGTLKRSLPVLDSRAVKPAWAAAAFKQ